MHLAYNIKARKKKPSSEEEHNKHKVWK